MSIHKFIFLDGTIAELYFVNRERLVSGNEKYIFGAYINSAILLSELRSLHIVHRAVKSYQIM